MTDASRDFEFDSESDEPQVPPGPSYAFRASVMGGAHFFRLGEHALYYEIGHHAGSISYLSIRRLRLSFRPMSLATYRFVAEIWSDNAPKLTIASTSWHSFVEQRRQDGEYKTFVRELAARIGRVGGTASLETGTPPFIYWPGLVLCVGLVAVLPFIAFRGLQSGSYGGAALIAGLLVLFAWQIVGLFYRNRPGTFPPDLVPAAVLPRG